MATATNSEDESTSDIIYPYPGKAKSSVCEHFGFKKNKVDGKMVLDMTHVICKIMQESLQK